MFVRILQILVLLAIINTSTSYIIRDITIDNATTYNDTKIPIDNVHAKDQKYPIHKVNYHSRGWLHLIVDTCIHFLDWEQKSMWTHCSSNPSEQKNGEILSGDWSVGYYICGIFETSFKKFEYCSDPVLWWDGWVGQKYCNDLHYHLTKSLNTKLSFHAWPIGDGDTCQYP